MYDSNLRKHQLELFNGLLGIKSLLDRNGIRFFLLGGSCLGAIRHKGFIPWDDDIDIGIFREDFEKFVKLCGSWSLDGFMFVHPEKNVRAAPFARFVLVPEDNVVLPCIDVFPLDKVPDSKLLRTIQRYFSYMYHLTVVLRPPLKRGKFFNICARVFLRFAPVFLIAIIRKFSFFAITSGCRGSMMVANFFGAHGIKEVMPGSVFGDGCAGIFEGHSFNLPAQVDLYLRFLYGNFMVLPPESERRSTHN